MANDTLKDTDLKYAYDVFGQTNFAQEETIYKGLQHSKKMSQEERDKTFWHIVNNKRMFNALIEIVPYYFAWMLASILLVNVSNQSLFLTFLTIEVIWKTNLHPDHPCMWRFRRLHQDILRSQGISAYLPIIPPPLP